MEAIKGQVLGKRKHVSFGPVTHPEPLSQCSCLDTGGYFQGLDPAPFDFLSEILIHLLKIFRERELLNP